MLPLASVTHHMNGRLRIRIPSQRRNAVYFSALQEKLARCAGVQALQVNPLTAGVLIQHQGDMEIIRRFAEENQLFILSREASLHLPVARQISNEFASLDERLSRATGGKLDIASAAFLGLTCAGLFQLLRRHIWPPGFTLLWYAASVLPKAVHQSPPDSGIMDKSP
jgi:Heavy metal associated domain 2